MRAIAKYLFSAVLAPGLMVSGVAAQVREAPAPLDWRTFVVPEFGTRVDYPAGVFVPAGDPEQGVGRRFDSTDGRATLSIYARSNETGETPASYLRKNLRTGRGSLGYERITPSFFAISQERGGLIYYSRCNFSGREDGSIHCFDLVYPQAEKRAWDRVVTRISLSLRPLQS